MRRFFEREDTRWSRDDGALHVYIVPGVGALPQGVVCTHAALAQLPGLTVQPPEFLHCTVQRFDAHIEVLREAWWQEFRRAVKSGVKEMEPFRLHFAAPTAEAEAVEAVGVPNREWQQLLSCVRGAAAESGVGKALTEPPYGPHYTLAYCTGETDDREINSVLDKVGEPSSIEVDTISLVSVTQRPDVGIFEFETLDRWSLAAHTGANPQTK